MSAMRALSRLKSKGLLAYLLSLVLSVSVLIPIEASALSFNSAPARFWGHIYASEDSSASLNSKVPQNSLDGEVKSEWRVTYNNFPAEARDAVQHAIDIWSRNFESKVPINIEASWERSFDNRVLGSARPGYYFNDFPGAPTPELWYPSALANALAGRDLDPKQREIFLTVNSTPLWYTGTDGKPNSREYDLTSVVLHEIAHGLGFLSNAEYDSSLGTGTGYMFQPTPFDAYVQLPDGRTLTDFCSRSIDLGNALLGPLYWSGASAISANNGVKPKLYTPSPYEDGSSITHLDETTFSGSAANSAMTPNLSPGEVFRSPGPIALGMINDMLSKPPDKSAAEKPSKPVNFKALVGDGYAILTFDSLNCARVDRIKNYSVTISPGGETKSFTSSPIRIGGLKNGKSYKFSLVAINDVGQSDPIESSTIKPQKSGAITTVDAFSRASNLATSNYRNAPIIIYGDEASQTLKQATYSNKRWRISTIRRNVDVGAISICKSGIGAKETLHVFYGELSRKDLFHSYSRAGKWNHEVVDGNGDLVQDYRELLRVRTASDVSVSNACAVTPAGLQVFYRDETQGILLGAVKTTTGWVYEIVDGDRSSENRTTGDVAFSISAIAEKNSVHLLYDSVLTINSSGRATEGEVRYASRKTIFPEDWRYKTLDGPEYGNVVAGYATSLANRKGKIIGMWLLSRGDSLPDATQIAYTDLSESEVVTRFTPSEFGLPASPLAIDNLGITFGCSERLCKSSLPKPDVKLASGLTSFSKSGGIIFVGKVRYMATSLDKKLSLVRL